jgi:hypothetical protein
VGRDGIFTGIEITRAIAGLNNSFLKEILNVSPDKVSNLKMKYLFILITMICTAASCMAQSTNSESATTSWGKPVRDVQMSLSIGNNVIATSSDVTVTIEVKNSSTNLLVVSGSMPEANFTVSLADEYGRTYQLTRSSEFYNRSLISYIRSGQSRTWIIRAGVNQYFESPGAIPTSKDVPPGDYVLKATGSFRFKDGAVVGLESELKLQIK